MILKHTKENCENKHQELPKIRLIIDMLHS